MEKNETRPAALRETSGELFGATVDEATDAADDASPDEVGVIGPIAWIEMPRAVTT